jgi:hypothetical protein
MSSVYQSLTALIVLGGVAGCPSIGPASLAAGRQQYADAINATNDLQTLNMIVAIRYDETFSLMSVASVTANVRVTAGLDAEFPIGSEDYYRENLVPLSAGFAYEENPTISYMPIQGERYVRQFFSPLPIDLVAMLQAGTHDPTMIMFSLVDEINGIRNPAFLYPGVEPDPRFGRVIELVTQLTRASELRWVKDPSNEASLSLVIFQYANDLLDEVIELAGLLGLSADASEGKNIVLPVRLEISSSQSDSLRIQTRSAARCVRVAAGAVEVPAEHLDEGLTRVHEPLGEVGRYLTIRSSRRQPKGALVAVQRHDTWFYIDGKDHSSKQFFRWLQFLISLRLSDASASPQTVPVLTVPVSR